MKIKVRYSYLWIILLLRIIPGNAQNIDQHAASNSMLNQESVLFEKWFSDKTMRFDFFHTGNATQEMFSVDQVVSDGPWAGSLTQLIDKLELGPYFFEVKDKESGRLLYSRGFANIFGEWQTTPEASGEWKTFHESLRFPWPNHPVILTIKKRDTLNRFQSIWSTTIDPSGLMVNPAERIHRETTFVIEENGPAHNKLDIVILGDGYSGPEMKKFGDDARRLSEALLNTEPFKSQRQHINIRAVETPAPESGVNKPHQKVFRHSPLAVSYGIFDSERYALTFDNKTVRDIASAVPYDVMVILMNERTYGGGGIYNLYTTVSAGNRYSEYIMVHEMGHHLAALADEYYTSAVAYEAPKITLEPWELNVTALHDPGQLKWKEFVEPATPIPTPWNKEAFDKQGYAIQVERQKIRAEQRPETDMEALFDRQLKLEDAFFADEPYHNKVGAFEGANYNARGMYRSQLDCIMYTRHRIFCKVCQNSLVKVISQYTK